MSANVQTAAETAIVQLCTRCTEQSFSSTVNFVELEYTNFREECAS